MRHGKFAAAIWTLAMASVAGIAADTPIWQIHQAPDKDGIYYTGPEVSLPVLEKTFSVPYPSGVPAKQLEGLTVLAMVIDASGKPDHIQIIAERLPAPLMFMMSGGRLTSSGLTMREWGDLGYRLFVDASTPFMAMHHALRACYAAMARGESDPLIGADTRTEQHIVHETIGLDAMLAIEKRTVEK